MEYKAPCCISLLFFTLDAQLQQVKPCLCSLLLKLCFSSQAADSPHLLSVPVTWVKEGGMVRLNKKYLQVDYKGVSSDDVVYTIHTQEGHPKYGNTRVKLDCLRLIESPAGCTLPSHHCDRNKSLPLPQLYDCGIKLEFDIL